MEEVRNVECVNKSVRSNNVDVVNGVGSEVALDDTRGVCRNAGGDGREHGDDLTDCVSGSSSEQTQLGPGDTCEDAPWSSLWTPSV